MIRRCTPLVLVAVGVGALLCASLRAAIIPANVVNVDFDISSPASSTYSGLAAGPATAGATWNAVTLGAKLLDFSAITGTTHNFGPTSAGTLLDSGGASTALAASLTVAFTDIRQYYTDENPLSVANGGDLLNDYAYLPGDRTSATFTIGGIPSGSYDLYLYSQNGNYGNGAFGSVSTFTVGASSKTANNTNASTGVYTLNRNYVTFTGLSAVADGSLFTVTLTGGGVLDGFQLVQTAVPEPSGAIFVALFMLPLLRRRG